MEKTSKEMRQFRVESGISSNQLRAFVATLLEKGITVDSLKSEDLTDVSETILDLWNVSIDSRHSDQMHRYLIFAICSTIPEGALDLENPVLLPFSRQKVFISLPLAFHLIRINGKLGASLGSCASGLLQVVSSRQLQIFMATYLEALWMRGTLTDANWRELVALMTACPDQLLPAWWRLSATSWRELIDRASSEEHSGSLLPTLSLLLRLLNCELPEEPELPKGLPGLVLLWRLYGRSLLRSDAPSAQPCPGPTLDTLKTTWIHLLAQGKASQWTALLTERVPAVSAEALAARDLQLALLLGQMPSAEPPREAELRRGADAYLEREYGTEERVVIAHSGAIERRLLKAEEEDFVRWLLWDVSPHVVLRCKSLTNVLIEKIVPLASPEIFLHLLKTWPNGPLTTAALRRTLAGLSSQQRLVVHAALSELPFAFPNGREAWHQELRRCLNRAAASDPEAASQELNLLALYDAAGVLQALVSAGMQHKGSFELIVALLQRASHLFLLPPSPPRPGPPGFLLGLALQGALANETSPEHRASWRRMSDAICGLLPAAGSARRLLLTELVLPGLRSKRYAAELLQLASSLLEDADADIAAPDQLQALFVFALLRIRWRDVAIEKHEDQEEEEEEEEKEEEEAALALVIRLQEAPFLHALASPPLSSLLLRFPLPARLLTLEMLRAAGHELSLPGRLAALLDAEEMREAGCKLDKATETAPNTAAVAEAVALAASSPAAGDLLAARIQLAAGWEPVQVLVSALLHAAHVMPPPAWRRLPDVLIAVLRTAGDRMTYRPLGERRLPATDLTGVLQQLAVVEILGETSILLLQASLLREAGRSFAAARALLANVARSLQSCDVAAAATFLRSEATAWTRHLLSRCPRAWSQSSALSLVLQELEKDS